jgi:hypothetical protein
MSKPELREYAAWFHEILPARLGELTRAVRETVGFEGWAADESPESLDALGRWLTGQVETRARSDDELAAMRADIPAYIEIPAWELTTRTFSLAMDVGMYFAQVILRCVPETSWIQVLKNKRDVDYGQPVIVGKREKYDIPVNPVQLLIVFAYSVASGKPRDLRRLYDIHAGALAGLDTQT